MLVEKIWYTGKYSFDRKVWRGWFLLGFIPIYIKQLYKI